MQAGMKVLYIGCGSGEDAIQAAKKGAQVTCIDISPKMIKNTEEKMKKEGVSARLICEDIFNHTEYEEYDFVTANYFLNNFSPEVLPRLIGHISKLVKKDGNLMIADFIAMSRNPIIRFLQKSNFYIAVTFFWILGVAPLHKYQNFTSYFEDAGILLSRVDKVRLFNFGVPLYGNIIGNRKINDPELMPSECLA
jgi:demethylmenaquinone methyltransferase/2-methoxy-6-polyprenyl-1,4-benzoquinol methylase